MSLRKSFAVALLATTGLCGVAQAQKSPLITPGTTIQPGFVAGLLGGKLDTADGIAVRLSCSSCTLMSPQLLGIPTAPTPTASSGPAQIATKGYVEANSVGAFSGTAPMCQTVSAGAALQMSFDPTIEDACYNITLNQNSPALTIAGGAGAGAFQRILIYISEPGTASYLWAPPTSSAGVLQDIGVITPVTGSGQTSILTATTPDGGAHIYLQGGNATSNAIVPPTTATAIAVDTPAWGAPNTTINVSGIYQGFPQALDYNLGSGWFTASSPSFVGGVYNFQIATGAPAGSYILQVRDHNAQTVSGTSGTAYANAWSPSTLTTSPGAAVVFDSSASDPTLVSEAGGNAGNVLDSLNNALYLVPTAASGGNPVRIAHSSGSDGLHRVLQFNPTTLTAAQGGPTAYDPATNWLDGAAHGGATLIGLANSANIGTSGSFTTVISECFNQNYNYAIGVSWGAPATPGPVNFAETVYNAISGFMGAVLQDASGGVGNATGTISAGCHVVTDEKNGGVLTYRLDGNQIASSAITGTGAITATDFMVGGGFPAGSAGESGVPPQLVGGVLVASGDLAGTDLAEAEIRAGTQVGLTLSPTIPTPITVATALTVVAPSGSVAGQPVVVTGTFQGTPSALDYSVDGSSTYTQAAGVNFNGSGYTFDVPSLTAGSHVIVVRDHYATAVQSAQTAFTVAAPAVTQVTGFALNAPTGCVAFALCTFTGTYTGAVPTSLQYQLNSLGWGVPSNQTFSGNQFSFVMPAGNAAASGANMMAVRDAVYQSVSASVQFTETPATTQTTATSLTAYTPAAALPSAAFNITGIYVGTPTQLDYSTNNGSTWTTAASATITNGSFTIPVSQGLPAGSYILQVRDHNATTVASATGSFLVSSYDPNAQASYVWGFDTNNTSSVPTASNGSVSQVFNTKTGATTQYLTAKLQSASVALTAANQNGADGLHRVIVFKGSTNSQVSYSGDTTTNGLNGVSSTAGSALVNLANSTNVSNNGAFTAIIAAKSDTSLSYENYLLWEVPGYPGPLQYAQLFSSGGNIVEGLKDTSSTISYAQVKQATSWYVFTVTKDTAGNFTFWLNGTQAGTTVVTPTGPITAKEFDIGGVLQISNTGTWYAPPPYVSGMEVYSSVLTGATLSSAQHLVGSSAGITW